MDSLVMLSILALAFFTILLAFLLIWMGRYFIRKLTGHKPEALLRATQRSIDGWVEKP